MSYDIKMNLKETRWGGGGVERIHLALDTDRWQFAINTVMNFRVQENGGGGG